MNRIYKHIQNKSTEMETKVKLREYKQEIEFLNKEIERTYLASVEESISDEKLLDVYREQQSFQKKMNKIRRDMLSVGIEEDKIKAYMNKAILDLVPPQLKAVIRGNLFNQIVKNFIENLELNNNEFVIEFEKQHPEYECSDKPDFYIYHSLSKKLLVGMNQLDLWNGGQQNNRASKYVTDERFHLDHKTDLDVRFVSIICNFTRLKTNKEKKFKLFKIGFETKRLCYLNGLKDIIHKFFCIQ